MLWLVLRILIIKEITANNAIISLGNDGKQHKCIQLTRKKADNNKKRKEESEAKRTVDLTRLSRTLKQMDPSYTFPLMNHKNMFRY